MFYYSQACLDISLFIIIDIINITNESNIHILTFDADLFVPQRKECCFLQSFIEWIEWDRELHTEIQRYTK